MLLAFSKTVMKLTLRRILGTHPQLLLSFFSIPPLRPSMPQSISRRTQLQEDTYFRVLRLLQANPDLTQRELAEQLGVSVGGLNYCLKALIDKGWVKMQNFSASKNKFGYVYLLTPSGLSEKARLTSSFLQRKLAEYEALKQEIESLSTESAKLKPVAVKPAAGEVAATTVEPR